MHSNSPYMKVLITGFTGVVAGAVGAQWADAPHWIQFFDNSHWTFGTTSAALLAWMGLGDKVRQGDLAQRWIVVGLLAYALGQLIWDVQQIVAYQGFPTPSDLFYLCLGPALTIGLFKLAAGHLSSNQQRLFMLDCTLAGVVAVALVMVFYLPKRGDTDSLHLWVLIIYPASLLIALVMALLLLPTLRFRPNWPWFGLVLGLTMTSWSWMVWNDAVLDALDTTGAWFNSVFSFGILTMGVAVVHLRLQAEKHPPWERRCEAVLRFLPLGAVILAALAVIATQFMQNLPIIVREIIWSSSVLVMILAAIRQHTLLLDYDRLILTEAILEQERQLLTTIVEGLPGAFVLLNQQGDILKYNSYAARFVQSAENTLSPMPIHAAIPKACHQAFDKQLQRVWDLGEASFEQWLRLSDAQIIPHGFSFKRVQFHDGDFLMGIGIDISELRLAMTALEESHNLLQQVVDTLPLRVFWKDRQSRYLGCNILFARDAGVADTAAVKGLTDYDLAWSEQETLAYLEDDQAVMSSLLPKLSFDERLTPAGGERMWIRTSKVPLLDTQQQLVGILGVFGDVTEQKHLEEMQQLAALVFEHSRESIIVSDTHNKIIAVNPSFSTLTGYSSEEVIGHDPKLLRAESQAEDFYVAIWQSVHQRGYWEGETWGRRKNGELYPQRLSISVVRHDDGTIFRYVAMGADISDKKQAEQLIWQQANFDVLTDLPNRRMLIEHVTRELKLAERGRYQVALLFLDLDHFKNVNDSLGHHMGDVLLVEAAKRMRQCVRETDTLSRLGGDEFAIIVPHANREDIERIAYAILETIRQPFALDKEQAYVSTSIGIASYPADGASVDELLKKADQAMYAAKQSGRSCFHYFKPEMQEAAMLHMRLAADMRSSLEMGDFALYFQPIVDLTTGQVIKSEALLRWKHPLFGFISPDRFIPIAEGNGFIHELGSWVFNETLQWSRRWRELLGHAFVCSMNLSPVQLMRGDYFDDWLQRFAASGLGRGGLVLEITEGVLLSHDPEVNQKLMRLNQAGMQLSIDDFGTGYSALSYLNKFPLHYLKIDKSFVESLTSNERHRALVEGIVMMAHQLNLAVIAEGIETPEQQGFLQSIGCDYGQGYWFSKPITALAFEATFVQTSVPGLPADDHCNPARNDGS